MTESRKSQGPGQPLGRERADVVPLGAGRRNCPLRRASGFTLLEVMFSVMILGVGLVAVAAIFPVASQRQKETFEQVSSQQIVENVKAILLAKGLDVAALTAASLDSGNVQAVPATVLDVVWPMKDRSFPSSIADLTQRAYYCVPLVRKDGAEWQVFVFVLRRPRGHVAVVTADDFDGWSKGGVETKMVTNVTAGLASIDTAVGDVAVVVSDGQVTRITADNNDIGQWHAQVLNNRSPYRQIVVLGSGVVR